MPCFKASRITLLLNLFMRLAPDSDKLSVFDLTVPPICRVAKCNRRLFVT